MSEAPLPWSYRVDIEMVGQDGSIIGTCTLTGGSDGSPGTLSAKGCCNFGSETGPEMAEFLIALAGDLRGAHPTRLNG